MTADPVYLHYSQAELDQALDQATYAPNWREMVAVYEQLSQAAWTRLRPREEAYGQASDERIDFYPATRKGAPLLLMLHGGGWRMMGRRDVAYAAPTFLDAGVAYAAPTYGLLPATSLTQMAERSRQVVAWAHANAQRLGIDPQRIYVGGLSAGAHLAGLLLATDWTRRGLPPQALAGGVLVSGIYDARALAASRVYGYVGLDTAQARALSPMLQARRVGGSNLVAWGEREPPEFARQSRAFAASLSRLGRRCETLQAEGKTHFAIALDLADPSTALSRAAVGLITRP